MRCILLRTGNHQANMTFVINENDMSVEQSYYDVMNIAQAGYVSHSFNQFIQADGGYIYRADHGDALPRAISITKCGVYGDITDVDYALPVSIGGEMGDNRTGASIGGFELSSENCVIAGNAIDYSKGNINYNGKRNIFISITDKNLERAKMVWLTQYKENEKYSVHTPHLTKIGDDQFLVMWEESADSGGKIRTRMVTIDGSGNMTSDIGEAEVGFSDCKPVQCSDGLVRWYTTQGSSPVIYAVNPFSIKANTKGRVKVTYNANGGEVSQKSITVSAGSKYGKLAKPTRKGYQFKGWYTKKSGGSMKDTASCKYGKTYNLPANAFTRKGYKFAGWATTPNGPVKYKNKAAVKNLTSKNGKTVTLYAKWKKK